ncbi:MAG: glycoside hydrolase family 2 protein [Kiritimatiellia bacterium]
MKNIIWTAVVLVAGALAAMEKVDLNGLWDFRFERGKSLEEVGAPGFAANDRMVVPGCWNSMSHWFNQHGTGLYRTRFALKDGCANAFLVVDGCGLRSKYWIDGREVGFSKLPWSRFEFETGALAAGEHELVAAVDSIVDNAKVKLFWDFYDFYPFGGFHHGVWLDVQARPVELRRVVVRTRDYRTGRVELEAQFAGAGAPGEFTAAVAFDGAAAREVAFTNRRATVSVPNARPWSPEAPHLHRVSVAWPHGAEPVRARFGVRQVGTAAGRVTLNGRPVYLKGVNRHEAHYEFGATTPVQLMYEDVKNLKDLGGNFIRGSHYAQCERFLDLCDELGVLVWEESLGWGNRRQQLADTEFRQLQEEETRLMVRNSINHPCVIISAFLNEPDSNLPECKSLVERLIDVIRAEDTGHLVTFASHRTSSCISHAKTDLIAYNTYPCWYGDEMTTGEPEEMRANIRRNHERIVKYFRDLYKDERPILVSETGVKADYGVRDPRGRAQYTEDFQAEYEQMMLEEMFAVKEIAGVAIWQFTDCKTYTRTKGMRNRSYGVNTGGLYDLYRRPKLVVDVVREQFGKDVR